MATKLGIMTTYLEGFLIIKSFSALINHVVLKGHVTNENHYIFPTKVPMANKLGKMVTYLDGHLNL